MTDHQTELNTPLLFEESDSQYPVVREQRKSPLVAYIGLVVAVAAVVIGSVALYEAKQNAHISAVNMNQAADANQLQALTTTAQGVSSNIVIAHPACQGDMGNYKTCMDLIGTMNKVIKYAYNPNTTYSDMKDKIEQDGFGTTNQTSVILHDGSTLLASDSTGLRLMGDVANFLSNVSHCDYTDGTVCFACIPIPNTVTCLPIVHHVNSPLQDLSSVQTNNDLTRRKRADSFEEHNSRAKRASYSSSDTAFSKSTSASAVVGTPQVGANIKGSASVNAGGSSFSASDHDGNDQIGAQESGSLTAISAKAQESGSAIATKDGFGVTGSENAEGQVYAGGTEEAHADAGVSNGEASFNVGAGAEVKADASVSGSAKIGVDTPMGDDNGVIQAQGQASVSAHAGASASVTGSLGKSGANFHYGAQAGAGVSADASGSITGLDGAINIHGNVGVNAGPQVGTSGGFHATDKDGDISIGASGGLAAGLGLKAGASININTKQIGNDIVDGVQKIGSDIEDGAKDVYNDVTGNDDAPDTSNSNVAASAPDTESDDTPSDTQSDTSSDTQSQDAESDDTPSDTSSESDDTPSDTAAASDDTPSDTVSDTDTQSDDTPSDTAAASDDTPSDTESDDTAPSDTASDDTAPSDTASDDTAPSDTASDDTAAAGDDGGGGGDDGGGGGDDGY